MEENKKPNNPPAFPEKYMDNSMSPGHTLRDYFAAKAMQAMVQREHPNAGWSEGSSKQAYFIADAMLKERENQ